MYMTADGATAQPPSCCATAAGSTQPSTSCLTQIHETARRLGVPLRDPATSRMISAATLCNHIAWLIKNSTKDTQIEVASVVRDTAATAAAPKPPPPRATPHAALFDTARRRVSAPKNAGADDKMVPPRVVEWVGARMRTSRREP